MGHVEIVLFSVTTVVLFAHSYGNLNNKGEYTSIIDKRKDTRIEIKREAATESSEETDMKDPIDVDPFSLETLLGFGHDSLVDEESPPLVSTVEGVLRGIRVNRRGSRYVSFEGIPYASEPIRFQAAKPYPSWNGTKDAKIHRTFCIQRLLIMNEIAGTEDCLFLDVHTPSLNVTALPVLVVIHGGGFRFGMGNSYVHSPELLMKHGDMIVVSFNYRLGVLGFLATRTADAPGNVGMKDIVEALRWIQRNIQAFGGDPNRVALYGISSGAAAIEFLLLSKMATGLFSKVIIQSGSALNYINFQKEPVKYAFRLGKYLNQTSNAVDDLMTTLRNATADEIIWAAEKVDSGEYPMSPSFTFTPCVEDPLPGVELFLGDDPYNIMRSGNFISVPSVMGFNNLEGLLFAKRLFDSPEYLSTEKSVFEYLMPTDLMEATITHSEKTSAMDTVKSFYFNDKNGNATIQQFVDFMGDHRFLIGLMRSINIRLKISEAPIYYWVCEFEGRNRDAKFVGLAGAGHAVDIELVLHSPFNDAVYEDPATADASLRLITMVYNFIACGNPTPNITEILPVIWHPIQSKETLDYLSFNEKMAMKKDPNRDRRLLWERLYSKIYDA